MGPADVSEKDERAVPFLCFLHQTLYHFLVPSSFSQRLLYRWRILTFLFHQNKSISVEGSSPLFVLSLSHFWIIMSGDSAVLYNDEDVPFQNQLLAIRNLNCFLVNFPLVYNSILMFANMTFRCSGPCYVFVLEPRLLSQSEIVQVGWSFRFFCGCQD